MAVWLPGAADAIVPLAVTTRVIHHADDNEGIMGAMTTKTLVRERHRVVG